MSETLNHTNYEIRWQNTEILPKIIKLSKMQNHKLLILEVILNQMRTYSNF